MAKDSPEGVLSDLDDFSTLKSDEITRKDIYDGEKEACSRSPYHPEARRRG